jgi:hypothetical protein
MVTAVPVSGPGSCRSRWSGWPPCKPMSYSPTLSGAWLIPPVLALGMGSAIVLTLARLRSRDLGKPTSYPTAAATAGVLVLLLAPTAWVAHDVLSSQGGGGMGLPSVGPRSAQAFGPPGGGPGGPPGGPSPAGSPTKAGGATDGAPKGGGPPLEDRADPAVGTRTRHWLSICRPTGATPGTWSRSPAP